MVFGEGVVLPAGRAVHAQCRSERHAINATCPMLQAGEAKEARRTPNCGTFVHRLSLVRHECVNRA